MLALAITGLLASITPAAASYQSCIDKAVTNPQFGACGGAYVQQADAALNLEWQRLNRLVTDAEAKASLLAEQRLWIAYREKACTFYQSGIRGREGEVLSEPSCIAKIIEQRTAILKDDRDDLSEPDGSP